MLSILFKRRFGALVATQFLGAFNDNFFKQALIIMMVYSAAVGASNEAQAGFFSNLAAALIILPYFIFSALAGQLADKFDKTLLVRYFKMAEIFLMVFASLCFYLQNTTLLFILLFLMGTQSAFFGPIKYSILPQLLTDKELLTGNGLIEMTTFLAILLGIMAGGHFIANNPDVIIYGVTLIAVLGLVTSFFIPRTHAIHPSLTVGLNPIPETKKLIKLSTQNKTIFESILGISWLWAFGATVLSLMPNFTRYTLSGDSGLATWLIATFIIGIAIGSILCIKLSRGEVEIGMVPFGAIGLTLFSADLYFIPYETHHNLITTYVFLIADASWAHYRVIIDLIMLGIFTSFFVIPLYTTLQVRSKETERSRIIAANNIINALFMVIAALLTMLLYQLKFSTPEIFLLLALINIVIATHILVKLPEFFMRFVFWLLATTIYRLKISGQAHIPQKTAAVVICNHVSFIDWFIIIAGCRRPVRFVMDYEIYKHPLIQWAFKLTKAIPIAPREISTTVKAEAYQAISQALANNELICIFPEGKITYDGELNEFKPGILKILKNNPVPVIPMALTGLWGSFFSRKGGRALSSYPKLNRRHLGLTIGAPLTPTTSLDAMQHAVKNLM